MKLADRLINLHESSMTVSKLLSKLKKSNVYLTADYKKFLRGAQVEYNDMQNFPDASEWERFLRVDIPSIGGADTLEYKATESDYYLRNGQVEKSPDTEVFDAVNALIRVCDNDAPIKKIQDKLMLATTALTANGVDNDYKFIPDNVAIYLQIYAILVEGRR